MRDVFVRIEPRAHADDIEPGVAARIWDAAWILGRQWVLGEFDGEDAGTPVSADVQLASHRLNGLRIASGERRYDPGAAPLDAIVHGSEVAEIPLVDSWLLRDRVETGVRLMQLLADQGAYDELARMPGLFPLDSRMARGEPAAAAILRVAGGRVPDGEAAYREIRTKSVSHDWSPKAAIALRIWVTEIARSAAGSNGTRPAAWRPERLEYGFSVSAAGLGAPLSAPEHGGGPLDWFSFDLDKLSPVSGGSGAVITRFTAVPAPIRFPGMPQPRYWAFEDAKVDLGSVEAASTDLARMAMLQYAFLYGNDAFLVPVPDRLAVGAVHRVVSATVTDTFDLGPTRLAPATRPSAGPAATEPRQAWSLMAPAGGGGQRHDALFVPSVAAVAHRGEDVQDVRLFRDEMANLVWGVERKIRGQHGYAVDRVQELDRSSPGGFDPPASGTLRFRLQGVVPQNWFALELQPGAPRMLSLSVVAPSTLTPVGSVLSGVRDRGLHEEEVGREGVRVREAARVARWFGGQTFSWTSIERSAGRGEGSSGMRFDLAEP